MLNVMHDVCSQNLAMHDVDPKWHALCYELLWLALSIFLIVLFPSIQLSSWSNSWVNNGEEKHAFLRKKSLWFYISCTKIDNKVNNGERNICTSHHSYESCHQWSNIIINIKRFHIIRLEFPHHKEKVGFLSFEKDNSHCLVSLKPKLMLNFLDRDKHVSNVIVFRLRLVYEKRDLTNH